MTTMPIHAPVAFFSWKGLIVLALLVLVATALLLVWLIPPHKEVKERIAETPRNVARSDQAFVPTAQQWATLTVEPVQQRAFLPELVTEGKIAVDEDSSTPIFSPYAGRVTKLLVKPGNTVARGQPLFVVEATDMVQAQTDFITASAVRQVPPREQQPAPQERCQA